MYREPAYPKQNLYPDCKNCAMVACRRDYFSAKVPGLVSADGATNVYSLNHRAIMRQVCYSPDYFENQT
jgi:hypothetical protein